MSHNSILSMLSSFGDTSCALSARVFAENAILCSVGCLLHHHRCHPARHSLHTKIRLCQFPLHVIRFFVSARPGRLQLHLMPLNGTWREPFTVATTKTGFLGSEKGSCAANNPISEDEMSRLSPFRIAPSMATWQ